MPLPGLGQAEDSEGAKPFKPKDFKHGLPHRVDGDKADPDEFEHLEAYSIGDSGLLDCLEVDQFGYTRAPLPPALTPSIGLKFRTFDARIEAKYGVRNYLREISDFYVEIDTNIARMIPDLVASRDPIRPAIAIVSMYSEAHVYDIQVRRTKKHGRQSIYVRSLEPRPCHTRVVQANMEKTALQLDYEDDLLVLVQRELLLGKNSVETMWSLQTIAFTYHAMLRLWERGHGNGQTFHTVMAEAFLRIRGVTALVEICSADVSSDAWPSQIAVPLLDGFLVVTRRQIISEADELRWGFKRDRNWRGYLKSQDEKYFGLDSYFEAQGRQYTNRSNWFAVTFMGANDIGAWERSFAARQFNEIIEELNLDEVARYREWLDRYINGEMPREYNLAIPDPTRVMELQREMLPRLDPPDERWHFLQL